MVYRRETLGSELSAVRDLQTKLMQPVPETQWQVRQSLDGAVYEFLDCLPGYQRYTAGADLQKKYESPWKSVRYAIASAFASEPRTRWTPSRLQEYADQLAAELRDELTVIQRNYRAGYEDPDSIRAVLTDAVQLFEDSHAASALGVVSWIAKDKHLDPRVRKEARAFLKHELGSWQNVYDALHQPNTF